MRGWVHPRVWGSPDKIPIGSPSHPRGQEERAFERKRHFYSAWFLAIGCTFPQCLFAVDFLRISFTQGCPKQLVTTPWQQFFHPYSAVWRQRKTRGPQLANIKPPIQAAWISPPETYSRRHVLLAYLWLSLLTYTFSHVTISVTHFNIQKLPGCSCHIARWPPIPGFLGSGHQSRGEGRRKEDCPSPGLDSDPTRQH